MFVNILRGMESREPTRKEWETGKTVQQVLETPCRLVVKSQDKGHWLLSDAIHRACKCFAEYREFVRSALPPPVTSPIDVKGQHELSLHMRETFMAHMRPFLTPFLEYRPEKAHAALAVLCDPRLRRGEVFYWMCDPNIPSSEKLDHHRSMMELYTANHLIPFMVRIRMADIQERQPEQQREVHAQEGATVVATQGAAPQRSIFQVPDILLDDDESFFSPVDELGSVMLNLRERLRVEACDELKRFRTKDVVQGDVQPLKWWKENHANYPMLAPVVRIVLSCPGSQIECERVFSLCGATVALLRNRMSTDNLAQSIYVSKNIDQARMLQSLLQESNGKAACDSYFREPANRPQLETEPYLEVEDGIVCSNNSDEFEEDDFLEDDYNWNDVVE